MEVVQVLHMNRGTGETSYAQNSFLQRKVISVTQPIVEEAITNLYSSTFKKSLAIADLGCSSGPNTLLVASILVKAVEKICRKLEHQTPQYQVFLNDLPGNDFNAIFRCLTSFKQKMTEQLGDGVGPCFFAGVPGTFYGRLFQDKSLDFVHSSYSVMWLSQVPEGLEANKGNIYVNKTSPPSVLRAYYQQFQRDFTLFLRCRSKELVTGGGMVLTLLGRRSEDPTSKECCYFYELLAAALREMVLEGKIDEDRLDAFNIPEYTPSPSEVRMEVENEGSFTINKLEVFAVNWSAYDEEVNVPDAFKDGGYNVAKCIRAVTEPLLITHFGEAIIDEVFSKYRKIVTDRIAKEKTEFISVIVSLSKL